MNFDLPVPVKFPNLPDPKTGRKLPPGAKTALWSFNHDTGRWEIQGSMTISAAGNFAVTDPGVGVRQPGWHGTNPGSGGGGPDPQPPDPPPDPNPCPGAFDCDKDGCLESAIECDPEDCDKFKKEMERLDHLRGRPRDRGSGDGVKNGQPTSVSTGARMISPARRSVSSPSMEAGQTEASVGLSLRLVAPIPASSLTN